MIVSCGYLFLGFLGRSRIQKTLFDELKNNKPTRFYKPDFVHRSETGCAIIFLTQVLLSVLCARSCYGTDATNTRRSNEQATLPLFVLHRAGFTLPPQLPLER